MARSPFQRASLDHLLANPAVLESYRARVHAVMRRNFALSGDLPVETSERYKDDTLPGIVQEIADEYTVPRKGDLMYGTDLSLVLLADLLVLRWAQESLAATMRVKLATKKLAGAPNTALAAVLGLPGAGHFKTQFARVEELADEIWRAQSAATEDQRTVDVSVREDDLPFAMRMHAVPRVDPDRR